MHGLGQYAMEHGFAIVPKDSDVRHLSILRGSSRKVVSLDVCKGTANRAEFVLINRVTRQIGQRVEGDNPNFVLELDLNQ